MILDKELLTAFIAIFGIVLYALLNSRVSERSLPVISNSEVLDLASLNPEVVEDTCSICYSEVLYSGSFLTRCDHWYHKECLGRWFEQQEEIRKALSCPNCINPITSNANEEAKSYVENMKSKPFDAGKFIKFIKYIFLNSYHFDYEFLMNELKQIQPGFNINDTLEFGNTLFALAVKNSNAHAVEYFLKNMDKDINVLNEKEQDDLIISAIKCGHLEFALFMIEQTTVLERELDSIFFEAVKNEQVSVVELLIEKGADINKKEASSGLNAVQLASIENNAEVLKLLLSTGKADLNFVGESGMNFLESLIIYSDSHVVQMIFDHESPESVSEIVNKFDAQGSSPLLLACMYDDASVPQVLIKFGAESDLKYTNGISPIEYVIKNVNFNREFLEIILNGIKYDRQKVETILEYAWINDDSELYYNHIRCFFREEQKFNELVNISRNGYQESDLLKHQIAKSIGDPLHFALEKVLQNRRKMYLYFRIKALFEEVKFDLILDLILENESSQMQVAVFSTIEIDKWFKFFESILESDRKDDLIKFIEKSSNRRELVVAFIFHVYLIKIDKIDERGFQLNSLSKLKLVSLASSLLFRKFDADLYLKLVAFFDNTKMLLRNSIDENVERFDFESIETESQLVVAKFFIDPSVLSLELSMSQYSMIVTYALKDGYQEELIKDFVIAMNPEKLNDLVDGVLRLVSAEPITLHLNSLFKLLRIIPEEAQLRAYKLDHFRSLIDELFTISDFQIDESNNCYLTFKSRSDLFGMSEPMTLSSKTMNTTFECDIHLIYFNAFESSDIFQRYLQGVLKIMGQDKFLGRGSLLFPFHPENHRFLIESNEFVSLLQNNNTKLTFDISSVDSISIDDISETLKQKPIFYFPDLQNIPNGTLENWKKVEFLTGKSIERILVEDLIPMIENVDISIYLDARSLFAEFISSPRRELLKKIESKHLKALLITDFPELEALFEV